MAISQTGNAYTNQTNTVDKTISVNVPSDAQICLVFISWASTNTSATSFDKLNFDDDADVAFTSIAISRYLNRPLCEALYMLSPPSGDQTLYVSLIGSVVSEGATIHVSFWKGINTTTPIGDTEYIDVTSNHTNRTITLTGVSSGDVGFMAAYSYDSTANADPGGYGQTALYEGAKYNTCGLSIGYELDEDELYMDGGSYMGPVGFVLKVATSSASAVSKIMLSMDQFSGGMLCVQ